MWRPPGAAPGCACVHVCTSASSASPPLRWPGAKGLWAGLDWTAFFGSVRGQPALSMHTKRCPSSCRRGQLAGCCPAPEWLRGSWSQGRVCGATAVRRRWGGTGLTRRSLWPGVGCWNTWGGEGRGGAVRGWGGVLTGVRLHNRHQECYWLRRRRLSLGSVGWLGQSKPVLLMARETYPDMQSVTLVAHGQCGSLLCVILVAQVQCCSLVVCHSSGPGLVVLPVVCHISGPGPVLFPVVRHSSGPGPVVLYCCVSQ